MKIVMIIVGMIGCLSLFSQNVEIYSGINKNVFYDNIHNDPYYHTSYNSNYGYCVGFGVDNVKMFIFKLRFTLHLEKYDGNITARFQAMGGAITTEASVEKYTFSLGFYPINIRIHHNININLGFEGSKLLYEKYNGTLSGWIYKQSSWSHDLHDEFDHFSKSIYIGAKGRIAYDIYLSKTIILTPQYAFYYGITNEFQQVPTETKSYRHYLCIGIKKILK
jgi:hypothetical protein